MSFKAGDRIEVTSNTLGVAPRLGSVLSATGSGGLRVAWEDGHETVFFPSSNCRVCAPEHGAIGMPLRLGLHIDVTLLDEDDECRATVGLVTSSGPLQADGVARRKPGDAQIPMIGEELALGRALVALGEQLTSAARAHLSQPPSPSEHLVS